MFTLFTVSYQWEKKKQWRGCRARTQSAGQARGRPAEAIWEGCCARGWVFRMVQPMATWLHGSEAGGLMTAATPGPVALASGLSCHWPYSQCLWPVYNGWLKGDIGEDKPTPNFQLSARNFDICKTFPTSSNPKSKYATNHCLCNFCSKIFASENICKHHFIYVSLLSQRIL